MWDLIVSVPDHCLSFYFSTVGLLLLKRFRIILPLSTLLVSSQ